jgi:hypothetical protein
MASEMKMDELAFPVVTFDRAGFVQAWLSIEPLSKCASWSALRRGWFKGMRVVDSTGDLYVVTDARRLAFVGALWAPFGGWLPFLNPLVKVDLTVAKSGTMKLEQLKDEIVREVRRQPSYWRSAGVEVPRVSDCRSYSEVVAILLPKDQPMTQMVRVPTVTGENGT